MKVILTLVIFLKCIVVFASTEPYQEYGISLLDQNYEDKLYEQYQEFAYKLHNDRYREKLISVYKKNIRFLLRKKDRSLGKRMEKILSVEQRDQYGIDSSTSYIEVGRIMRKVLEKELERDININLDEFNFEKIHIRLKRILKSTGCYALVALSATSGVGLLTASGASIFVGLSIIAYSAFLEGALFLSAGIISFPIAGSLIYLDEKFNFDCGYKNRIK